VVVTVTHEFPPLGESELGTVSVELHATEPLSTLVLSTVFWVRRWDPIEPTPPVVHALGDPRLVLAVSGVVGHWTHRPFYQKLEKGG
jgi:hypothetical protein